MAKSKEQIKIERHKYYIANKEREQALHKIWKENNADKFKQLQQEYYETNKDYILERNKAYREENREDILKKSKAYKKNRYKDFDKHVVYLLINKNLETLYCGSSGNIKKRIEKHVGGWSHLELTKEKWDTLECSHFEYCYLDNVTKDERLYIESLLINKHNAILNSYEPIKNNNITEDRKCELEEYCDSLVFKIFNM